MGAITPVVAIITRGDVGGGVVEQYAGLEACQCRVDQAMVRHVGLVLLTFVVMKLMRRCEEESVGSVKERWQLEVMRDGQSSPPLLKACPPHLRATA